MPISARLPANVRAVLGPAVERVVYQDRLSTPDGETFRPNPLTRASLRATRALVERGIAPPWVWSEQQCREFWGSADHSQDGNAPADYAGKSAAIVDALVDFWEPDVAPSASVLEVGCNAGANLEALRGKGYQDLAGVEISEAALGQLHRSFPELSATARLHHGEAAAALAALPESSVDVVFSMAVLLHIHPSAHRVFEEMARVARRHVCIVEAEHVLCAYIFPRNYRRVFERLGCVQVREQTLTRRSHPAVDAPYFGYTERLFRAAHS
jgi:SAM-dependent methyltransferase